MGVWSRIHLCCRGERNAEGGPVCRMVFYQHASSDMPFTASAPCTPHSLPNNCPRRLSQRYIPHSNGILLVAELPALERSVLGALVHRLHGLFLDRTG